VCSNKKERKRENMEIKIQTYMSDCSIARVLNGYDYELSDEKRQEKKRIWSVDTCGAYKLTPC
jgi:hypothetical protein